jgi:F0F1-type ATP synthase membrane subunit c/vacuolar-type H+-ATPase subunit K
MKDSLLVPRILWAALFASTLIYLLVLEVVELQTGRSWETLLYPLAFAAVTTAGASLMAPRMMLHKRPSRGTSTVTHDGGYLTTLIVALALAESVAIFGLVLGFLGAPPTVVVPFFVVAWILMIIRFPTREKVDRRTAER